MRTFYRRFAQTLAAGHDVVLVAVTASSGSVPRGSGARMLVTARGRLCGTIGGGAVEHRCEELAQEVLRSRSSSAQRFRLYPNDVADLGMICGGAVEAFFRFFPGHDEKTLALLDTIETCFLRWEPFWTVFRMDDGATGIYSAATGPMGLSLPQEVLDALPQKPTRIETPQGDYYCEQILCPGKVYLFGGGHVSQALAPVLERVRFRCVVVEDRPEFLTPDLFPEQTERILTPGNDLSPVVPRIGPEDYICIMTRGHVNDFEVQRQVMKTPARYIGVIGSARKKKSVWERLMACGYTEKDFENVVSPIGLDIASETPDEIAISIAAQLILVRAGRPRDEWCK